MKDKKISKDFYVYVHRRQDNGQIFYVGKGKGSRAFVSSGRSSYWSRISKKHGFEAEIVKSNLTEDEAFKQEAILISSYDNLCNLTSGGEGVSGYSHTEETRRRLSEAHSGRKQSPEVIEARVAKLKGKKRDKDFCEAVRARNMGRTASQETRQKMSKARIGRIASKEAVEKTAAAHRGSKRSAEARQNMSKGHAHRMRKVCCVEMGLVFNSIEDAAKWLRDGKYPKATRTGVWFSASGKREKSYGYTWRYLDV